MIYDIFPHLLCVFFTLHGHQIGLLSCELNQTAQQEGKRKRKKAAGRAGFWVISSAILCLLADHHQAQTETWQWNRVFFPWIKMDDECASLMRGKVIMNTTGLILTSAGFTGAPQECCNIIYSVFAPLILSCNNYTIRAVFCIPHMIPVCNESLYKETKTVCHAKIILIPICIPFNLCMNPSVPRATNVQSETSILTGKHKTLMVLLHDTIYLNIFSVLVQAVENRRLKYSHKTFVVQLTQHLSPGWEGCLIPEGTPAACQLGDVPVHISDSLVMGDTRYL